MTGIKKSTRHPNVIDKTIWAAPAKCIATVDDCFIWMTHFKILCLSITYNSEVWLKCKWKWPAEWKLSFLSWCLLCTALRNCLRDSYLPLTHDNPQSCVRENFTLGSEQEYENNPGRIDGEATVDSDRRRLFDSQHYRKSELECT